MDVCDVASGGYKDRYASEVRERVEDTLWGCVMLQLVNVETGLPVKVGEMGEYCVDGPQKMIGYLHNKEATDEMIDKDGWLHTGALSLFIWLFPPPSPFFYLAKTDIRIRISKALLQTKNKAYMNTS